MIVGINNLTKTYTMGDVSVKALRGITLSVDEGEFVAIMGASGSGKSTLMNIIGCLDRPTGGTYTLLSHNAGILNRKELASIRNSHIGFVFQSFNLIPRTTALENVELPVHYRHETPSVKARKLAREALERVGLGERIHHVPNQLSGGQQQRVAIARALVNDPAILLADEPTGALDSHTSVEVMALFQELNAQGKTVIVVTHEPDIARYTKRIIRMRDGTIISDQKVDTPRSAHKDLAVLKQEII
ncbi:MAG TPA: ABC transporter ATP-binding protein [Chitinispirillaceae bacterium]|jgi:putative ABC transport system ATP-binding protein|nr:ABC transporter ATP-binding protein [Chitinispirillaceae bacterium]